VKIEELIQNATEPPLWRFYFWSEINIHYIWNNNNLKYTFLLYFHLIILLQLVYKWVF